MTATPDNAGRDELKGLRRRAADLNRNGEWGEEALELNTMIVELDPTDAAAHSRRGRCHRRRGNLESAEADYRRARELTHEGSSVLSHIDEAIAEIQQEVRDRAIREKREREELQQRRRERAGEIARQNRLLAGLSVADDAVSVARGARSEADPDTDLAARAYRRALQLDSSRLDIAVEWGALVRRADPRQALRIYERVLERSPGYRAARVGKAAVLVDQGAADEALALADAVLAEHPDDSYARRVKARAHAARGEMPEAVWHWENA